MAADYVYTTLARIKNVLSTTGTNLRLDDQPPDAVGDAINQASDDIDTYLWERYSPEQLSNSDTIAVWCANLAAWYLCTRRGNPPPPGVALRYEQVTKKLELCQKRRLSVPRLAQRKSYAPTLSVPTTTMRPFPRATIEKSRGTGTPANYSDKSSRDPADRLGANQFLDYAI